MKKFILAGLLAVTLLPSALAQDTVEPEFRPSYGVREDGSQVIYHRSGLNEIRQPDGGTIWTRDGKVTELKPRYDCIAFNQSQVTSETTPAYDPEDGACYLYDVQYIAYSCRTKEGTVEALRRRYIISMRKRNPAVPCDGASYTQARENAKTQFGEEEWPPPPQIAEEPKPPRDGPGLPLPDPNFKMPALPACFPTIEARWEFADKLYDMFLGQVNAISYASTAAAREHAKDNVEALTSLRARALLVDICPPAKTAAAPAPRPTTVAPPPPTNTAPRPRPAATPGKPATGFLTDEEARQRQESLEKDPNWPKRRAQVEKMIRERNKKGQDWLERDWFDWLFEQTGKAPADGCSYDPTAAYCALTPDQMTDADLQELVDDPRTRARLENLLGSQYPPDAGRARGFNDPQPGYPFPDDRNYPEDRNIPRTTPLDVPGLGRGGPVPGGGAPRF